MTRETKTSDPEAAARSQEPPDFERLVSKFDKFMRDAANARKRGLDDSEESFRNKANDLAYQIIAWTRKHARAAALPAAPSLDEDHEDHEDDQARVDRFPGVGLGDLPRKTATGDK